MILTGQSIQLCREILNFKYELNVQFHTGTILYVFFAKITVTELI